MKPAQVAIHEDKFVWVCPRGNKSVYVFKSYERDVRDCSGVSTENFADTEWSEGFNTVINNYPRSLL